MTTPDVLTVQNLNCRLGRQAVLCGVTLPALPAGQLVALIGPNGSGKSTLLRALAGVVSARAETLALGDIELQVLGAAHRARFIRYMPQHPLPGLRLSLYEALRIALRTQTGQAGTQRHDLESQIPALLDELHVAHLANTPLATLSGGQLQLAGLAQTLLASPPVLLLDEPLSNLDLSLQHHAMRYLRQRAARDGHLIIIVVHDLNIALRYAHQVLVLHRGAVHGSGLPTDVLTPRLLSDVFAVNATLETCHRNLPFIVVDDTPV